MAQHKVNYLQNSGLPVDLVALKMSLAGLFCTFWSEERKYLGQLAKNELQ